MNSRLVWWTGVLVALALLPAEAAAQRVVHRVRFGETLAKLSKYYYGKRTYAPILRAVNNLPEEHKLDPGHRLRIPTAWTYRVKRTTSVYALAKRLLGDSRRWAALGLANPIGRRKRIRAGRRLVIPFTLTHTLAPGETLEDLARRYYGKKRDASMIAAYNFLTDPAMVRPGARLVIPIATLKIRDAVLTQLLNERVLGVSDALSAERRRALQEANALLRRGEYWAVPLRLMRILGREQPSDPHMAEVYRLLGVAYVAVDRPNLAVRAFSEALLRDPNMTLNPVTHSPKVIRPFMDARTKLSRARR